MMVKSLLTQIDSLFVSHGFAKEMINSEINYVLHGKYRKAAFVKGLDGIVIEYANYVEEAQRNVYEDGDVYPLSLGETLVDLLSMDIVKHMVK